MEIKKLRVYAWLEFAIWLLIISIVVFGIRYHHYNAQKQYKSYQIFINDVDGLIVGSPVRFLGVQIGNVSKIQSVSSSVYVKFTITKKDLVLPQGVIATVEGSGLGGSKSLEIYLPEEGDNVNDKIIVAKNPTRLGKVISLFKDIFRELDSILTTCSNASKKLDLKNEIQQNSVNPEDVDNGLKNLNKSLDNAIESKEKIKNMILPSKNNLGE